MNNFILILIFIFIFLIYTLMLYTLINVLWYKKIIVKRLEFEENNIDKQVKSSFEIKPKSEKSWIRSLQKLLEQCGLKVDVNDFLKVYFIALVNILAITYFITKSIVICSIVMSCIFIITAIFFKYLKKRRINILIVQLLEMINFISSSLKGGYSLMQSLSIVTEQIPDPISSQFSQVISEINLGKTYEEAFNNLIQRNPIEEIELISTAIIINKEFGGNLTYILDTVSDTLRERQRLKGEIKSLTAQGRLSGMILTLLPIGVFGIILVTNPNYMKPMFQNTLGQIILGMGLIAQIIGTILIKKIIKIDG